MPESTLFAPVVAQFSEGGFLDGVKSLIEKAVYVINDTASDGTALEFPNIALSLTLGIEGRDPEKNYPQLFSFGSKSLEHYKLANHDGTPCPDGTRESNYLIGPQPNKNCAYAIFMSSLLQAGWPQEKMTADSRCIQGAIVTWKEVADDRNFGKQTENQKKTRTIKVVDYIDQYPWSQPVPVATAANTPRTGRGRPKAAETTHGPATANAANVVNTPNTSAAPSAAANIDDDLMDIAAQILQIILINAPNNAILIKDLITMFNSSTRDLQFYVDNGIKLPDGMTPPQFQLKVMKIIRQPDWLNSREEFNYENQILTLA